MKMARRFNAENKREGNLGPIGTAEPRGFQPSPRDSENMQPPLPAVETAGSFRLSLRDISISNPMKIWFRLLLASQVLDR